MLVLVRHEVAQGFDFGVEGEELLGIYPAAVVAGELEADGFDDAGEVAFAVEGLSGEGVVGGGAGEVVGLGLRGG